MMNLEGHVLREISWPVIFFHWQNDIFWQLICQPHCNLKIVHNSGITFHLVPWPYWYFQYFLALQMSVWMWFSVIPSNCPTNIFSYLSIERVIPWLRDGSFCLQLITIYDVGYIFTTRSGLLTQKQCTMIIGLHFYIYTNSKTSQMNYCNANLDISSSFMIMNQSKQY